MYLAIFEELLMNFAKEFVFFFFWRTTYLKKNNYSGIEELLAKYLSIRFDKINVFLEEMQWKTLNV